ncbi:MAG: radical SAM protein [Dickeya sp.]|uniref:Radical SAM domain protein n=1 Tax=Dickeya zeae (strain Ech586) TaxID=590409 RepID=D2BSD4_DICZ5|nr:radical SAM protein [Dickeya parazeae]ACZ75553.1 Radical SAM domain protein [Dickeya parazeae Ech586]PXW46872.1 MoaA/NifB/PqqE/SkfB family radical SAM enzyme [Erwinia sp. AG740]
MRVTETTFAKPYQDGWLDRIDETDSGFLIEGWAFRRDNNYASFPIIIVTSEWSEVARLDVGNMQRQDVQAAFPDCIFNNDIGFSMTLPRHLCSSRGGAGIQVFILNQDGTFSPLKKGFKRGLQVELSGRCNLRCPMCPSVIYSEFHKKVLDENDLPALVDFFQDRDFICLDGFGESLLSPAFDSLLDALPRASEVVFHTNGLLLDKKIDQILKNSPPVTWVAISLDSLEPEKYSRLRVGSSLDRVLKNVRNFKKKRDEMGLSYPVIRLNLTLMKENYLELENFVRTSLEFDGVVECNWLYDVEHLAEGVNIEVGNQVFDYESNKLKHIAHDANQHIDKAIALAKNLGVEVIFNSYFNENLSESPDDDGFSGTVRRSVSDCPHLQGDFMLQADGKVQNCVWQTSPLTDWREHGLENIKSHPRVQAVREMASDNIIPHECSGAGCSYIGLRKSSEEKAHGKMIGGYSGERVEDKKRIKTRNI